MWNVNRGRYVGLSSFVLSTLASDDADGAHGVTRPALFEALKAGNWCGKMRP